MAIQKKAILLRVRCYDLWKKRFFLSNLVALTVICLIAIGAYAATSLGDDVSVEGITINGDINIPIGQSYQQAGVGILTASSTLGTLYIGQNTGSAAPAAGTSHVAVGVDSIPSTATGDFNTAMGYNALNSVTSGYRLAAAGVEAMKSVTTKNYSLAVGAYAMQNVTAGNTDAAIGAYALRNNTSGSRNTAVGYGAAESSTTGQRMMIIGYGAIASSTTASYNTAIGYEAGKQNTNGPGNTHVGYQAGFFNQTGDYNNIVGYQAGYGVKNSSHDYNIFLGYKSGYTITTGDNNILIGYQAGDNVTTGAANIVIGYAEDLPTAVGNSQLNIGGVIYGDLSTNRIGIATTTFPSTFHVDGSFGLKYAAKTADYTLTATDSLLEVDATLAETTMTLPTADGIVGRVYTIKKTDASGNAVVLDGDGAETIDGSTTYSLSAQWKYATILSDGTNWLIVTNN